MNNSDELKRLVALVSEFEKLDALIIAGVKSGNLEIIQQTLEAKKKVKRFLSECKPLKVDRSLGLKLKKIRDNYGYTVDHVLESLAKNTGITLSQESEEDMDFADLLEKAFTGDISGYVDRGVFTRRNQIGTLIVNESIPDHILHHYQNLRECYALGLFEATVIYCRAVIETGCFEALRRKGKVKLELRDRDIREYSLKALMNSIKPFVYRDNWDSADRVIKKADDVLHSKRKKIRVTQDEAYDAIKDTFAIVEELFSGGHKEIRKR